MCLDEEKVKRKKLELYKNDICIVIIIRNKYVILV